MSTRISSAVVLAALILAACGGPGRQAEEARGLTNEEAQLRAAPDNDNRIPCAHGAAPLTKDCTVERATEDRGLVLTLRHPDGAFRRLLVTRDGRGVVAADGAQLATVTIVGADGIDVAIAGDHYRLPATIGKPAV